MVVAVAIMNMMQDAVYEVVEVPVVRHSLVPAVCAVDVAVPVIAARTTLRACSRILLATRDLVLVDMTVVHVMHMPVV
jgi:hypothetical protein